MGDTVSQIGFSGEADRELSELLPLTRPRRSELPLIHDDFDRHNPAPCDGLQFHPALPTPGGRLLERRPHDPSLPILDHKVQSFELLDACTHRGRGPVRASHATPDLRGGSGPSSFS